MTKLKDLTGQRFGSLTVIDRAPSITMPSRVWVAWNCQCDCGSTVAVRGTHLSLGYVKSCGNRLVHRPNLSGPRSYNDSHTLVRKTFGSARGYPCIEPDCEQQATEWAYDHLDPNEITTPGGSTYSTDPEHYDPKCLSHHRSLDSARQAVPA